MVALHLNPIPASTALRGDAGFTLIELVTVLVLAGILAAVAAPRFFSTNPFAIVGFANEVRAGLRHAQSVAIASGCDIQVELSTTELTLQRWTGGTSCNDHAGQLATLTRPVGGDSYVATVPEGVSVSTASLYFDTLGRPWDTAGGTLLGGELKLSIGTETVSVTAETGLVR